MQAAVSESPVSGPEETNKVVVGNMEVLFQSATIVNFRRTGEPSGNSGFVEVQLGHGIIPYESAAISSLEQEFGMPLQAINRQLTQAAEGRFQSLTIRSV